MSVYGTLGYGGMMLANTRNPFNYEKIEQISRDINTSWLTEEELKEQLNLYGDDSQDDYIYSVELATRMYIEDYLGMPIFNQTYRVYYGMTGIVATPIGLDLPQTSQGGMTINKVAYYNMDTPPVLTTIAKTQYYYDPTGNQVIVNALPNDISNFVANPVIVEYTEQPSILSQYENIKLAAKLLFTHFYNNRSETTVSKMQTIPYGVDVLLRPYKPLRM